MYEAKLMVCLTRQVPYLLLAVAMIIVRTLLTCKYSHSDGRYAG
jgi:hypothetical protein